MDENLKRIIEESKQKAARIIESTAPIRDTFAAGRTESTAEGTIEAFAEIMRRLPDPKQ